MTRSRPADQDEPDDTQDDPGPDAAPPAPRHGRGQPSPPAATGPSGREWGSPRRSRRRARQGRTYSRTVSDDVATDAARNRRAELRRRRVTAAGHRGDAVLARRGLADPDESVQVAALGALARLGELTRATSRRARAAARSRCAAGPSRRPRPCAAAGSRSVLPVTVTAALGDPDPLVVVGAAWFLAERRHRPAVPALARPAAEHDDMRCREAAVAALGAIGDPAGLPAVLGRALGQANGAAPRRRRLGRLRRPSRRTGAAGGRHRPRLAGAPGGRRAARRAPAGLVAPSRPG